MRPQPLSTTRTSFLAAALAAILAWGGEPAAAPAAARAPAGTGVRLVLIGLDGADWQIAGPLIEAGRLPHLARLRRGGAWGDLRSAHPMLSPLLWTSIATGKTPDQHGIVDFLVRDPRSARMVPITSAMRKARALWNIYSDAGRRVDIIAWWATWPAETINGHMISDRTAYSLFGYQPRPEDQVGLVSPPAYLAQVQPLHVDESRITLKDLRRFAPISQADLDAARAKLKGDPTQAYADPINHLVRLLASTRTYHAIALKLLRESPADLLAVYYQGIDEVGHRFAHYIPPRPAWVDEAAFEKYHDVVTRFYEYQDELIGELLEAAGSGVTVAVVSDHGFLNGSDRPDFPPDVELKAGAWHRLYGILVLNGKGIQPGRLEPTSLYDVAPTLLYLSGLPVAADMAGRPILDAIAPAFRSQFEMASVPTYEDPSGARSGGGPDAPAQGSSSAIDDEILAKLRSLGYIASSEIATGPVTQENETPASFTNMLNMAALELQKGDLKRSEEITREILKRRPEHAESHSQLSEVLDRQGRLEEAFSEARTALNMMDAPPERLVARYAQLARRLGRLDEAKAWFLRATQMRPGRGEPWLGLGVVQSLSQDWKGAQASFLRALELNPRSAAAVTGLSNVYERGGRSKEILSSIEAAVTANPDSAAHRALLGVLLSKEGDDRRAEQQLGKALELDPERDASIAGLCEVLLKTGRLDEARRTLEKAIARQADQVEVRMVLGRVYGKMGRMGEAIRQMSEATRIDPSNPSAHAQLGMLLSMQGQPARAIPEVEQALELDPALYELRLHLAILYHDAKRPADCEAQLKRAAEQRPGDPEPHRLLASLYKELGRLEEAERETARVRQITGGT
ncbi:MAG TPA: tetratricopeptide repeat protein [Candidatus Polarisedimenticolia bacterium]|jgi:predicted AlkP superfamily phosphohydrolase/phosphomutase/tetratricopeptide (TPR) repeat protein